MGIGIWAMHYIGMLAFRLPVPVLYNIPVVGLSLLAAIGSAAIALYAVSGPAFGPLRLGTGSVAMGSGILAMHYIGMAAMRLPAHCQYSYLLVAASGLIAIAVSGAALWITHKLRQDVGKFRWLRIGSAVVMGSAIAAMHYTGMAAVCFRSAPFLRRSSLDVSISSLAVQGIGAVTLFILLLTVISVVATRYVTLQKELLKTTRADYQLVMEHNLACICRTSLEGFVLEANQMTLKTLGYEKRADILGVDIADHYCFPEDRFRIINALEEQGFVNGLEVCMKRTDGQVVWVLYNLALAPGSCEGSLEVAATAMDISAVKRTQEDLRLAKEAAEAANRAKSQFLANMSHELRTPLNGILGMTTLALYCDLEPEVRTYLKDSKMSADSLLQIVNDVLDFSKVEAKQLVLDVHPFGLQQTLDDAVRTVAASAQLKNIALALQVDNPLPDVVLGDSERLRQVLLNLLGNAIKFTGEGGVILRVETTGESDQQLSLHITISDTGVGIPADKLSSIFLAFAQADLSDTRRFGGTGLGLAICSQLLDCMGGKIWVESTVGRGSTFHVNVDLALPELTVESGRGLATVGKVAEPVLF